MNDEFNCDHVMPPRTSDHDEMDRELIEADDLDDEDVLAWALEFVGNVPIAAVLETSRNSRARASEDYDPVA